MKHIMNIENVIHAKKETALLHMIVYNYCELYYSHKILSIFSIFSFVMVNNVSFMGLL